MNPKQDATQRLTPRRRLQAIAFALLLFPLMAALPLTAATSYAQGGSGDSDGGADTVLEQPVPQPEPELAQVSLPPAEPGEQLYIAQATVESPEQLAALQELGYSCAEGEICEILGTEAQVSVLEEAGFKVDVVGIVAEWRGSGEAESGDEDGLEDGTRVGYNLTDYNIPDRGSATSSINISGAPSNARVTKLRYDCRVALVGPQGGVSEYTLEIRPSSLAAGYLAWDRLGGFTDQGHDDDAEDDRDIVLNTRWINVHFDGQVVNQTWNLRAEDHVYTAFGGGKIDFWQLWVYYCTSGPSAPTLLRPAHGEHTCSTRPIFGWPDVSGADDYFIQVDDSPSFDSPAISTNSKNFHPFYQPRWPLARKTWYWRVRAHNECGYGPWSAVSSFTIDSTPSVPVLQSPANGSNTCNGTPTFSWTGASGATSYRIQIDDHPSLTSPQIDTTVTHVYHYTPATDLAPIRYYWRVRTENACGDSDWSPVRSVVITPRPEVPSSPSPAHGATGVSTQANLDWATSAGATSYDVYFGTSSSPPLLGNVTVSEYDLPTLAANTTYYWSIAARNAGCWVGGSSWHFTTAGTANHPPENVNLWPDHGGRAAGRRVNFTATYRDRDGWRDLAQLYLHIGSNTAARSNCRLRYDVRRDKLYLTNNAGTGWLGGLAPGSSTGIRNRQCTLNCAKSEVTKSGRVIKVKFNLLFRTAFRGRKNSYMQATDMGGAMDPWEQMGTWRVQLGRASADPGPDT